MPTDVLGVPSAVDWEVLQLATMTESAVRDAVPPTSDRVTAFRSRLRVRVAGRVGESWADGSTPGERELGEALAAACRGPRLDDPFGAGYGHVSEPPRAVPLADLTSILCRPHVLRVDGRRRSVSLSTSAGARVRWTHDDVRVLIGFRNGRRTTPLAVFDSAEVPASVDAALPAAEVRPVGRHGELTAPWLVSPIATSQLFGADWLAGMAATGGSCSSWPAACTIVDHGTGAPTDLEGTPRRPQVIVRDGRVLRPLRTLVDSGRQRDWTGHAGPAGADPEDLVLRPDTVLDAATDSPVCLITAARSLPAAPDVVVLTAMVPPIGPAARVDTILVRIKDGPGLLAAGQWTWPSQRGTGCWSLPWLRLDEPTAAVSVLELLDRADD